MPWFLSDFSELRKNKHVYTQPSHPYASDVCIANNHSSKSQKLQILKDITQYINSHIKYVRTFQVYVTTIFDVEQLEHINLLLKNKLVKVSHLINVKCFIRNHISTVFCFLF